MNFKIVPTTNIFAEIYGKWVLRILMGAIAKDEMVKMRKNAQTKWGRRPKKGDKEADMALGAVSLLTLVERERDEVNKK